MQLLGAAASAAWLEARGLDAARVPSWYVEIAIGGDARDVRFELNIYPEEWGFAFHRGPRVSVIRVTDVPFVHGRDDHQLLAETPTLDRIGDLLARLEVRHAIAFARARARVKSNVPRATAVVRPWLIGVR